MPLNRGKPRRATLFTQESEDAIRRKLDTSVKGAQRQRSRVAAQKAKVDRVAQEKRVEQIVEYCIENSVGAKKGRKWFRQKWGNKSSLVRSVQF
jgi:hypothetical protein